MLKASEREVDVFQFEILFQQLLGETEKNNEKSQS
jgi:hypothetical protein